MHVRDGRTGRLGSPFQLVAQMPQCRPVLFRVIAVAVKGLTGTTFHYFNYVEFHTKVQPSSNWHSTWVWRRRTSSFLSPLLLSGAWFKRVRPTCGLYPRQQSLDPRRESKMPGSLLLPFLVLWFWLTTLPGRTLAEPRADGKHLSSFFDEHKGTTIHGQGVHEKRKRGGRNYLLKRCNASEHSHGSKTPASSQASSDTNPVTAGESKKWGLGWPNGDASYLANFARPKVG